jgi:hypothetical protein
MKTRKQAGIRLALAKVNRAQPSRWAPLCNPPTPNTQQATETANPANHRFTGLSGRARQTKSARAARTAPTGKREICGKVAVI